ncbi:hypothetical protein [Streptomyces purpurascens]|uniref:hypothetical protein n=1 Tax=Streptomyces purpurascens TaxID=1924 RepID=UPI00198E7F2B|nr:hypothetical protein [Streptomyces purpurascens]MCE7046951.1 hypothetical protein [Streptomyces purpurascens]GHA04301.1 hypothetical protein GCM10010303_12560 [Streptomyces purpurascens]
MTSYAFDVDAFLRRPLTARLATNGPTVRPVWFLWEEDAFWTTSTTIRRCAGRCGCGCGPRPSSCTT